MDPIKIVIADDSDFVRDGLRVIFELDEDFKVIGTAKNGLEAVTLGVYNKVDVFLMDIQMPEMDGIEATREITERNLGKVLVLTTFDDDELIESALLNGAKGYLIKNHTPDKIKQMVKALHSGGNILDETVFEKIKYKANKQSVDFDKSLFTPKEYEIITEIANGLSNKDIAAKLYISEGTVKNHISNILDKTGLSHRTQLAVYYLTGKK